MNNFKSLVWGGVLLLPVVVLALLWLFSGNLAASTVVNAAQNKNLADLVKRINLSRLKTTASEDLADLVPPNLKVGNAGKISESVRSAVNLGMAKLGDGPEVSEMLANLLIGKGFVTNSVIAITPREWQANRSPQFGYDRGATSDTYLIKTTFEETGEQVVITMERTGLFTWKVVRIVPNSPTVLWPFKTTK